MWTIDDITTYSHISSRPYDRLDVRKFLYKHLRSYRYPGVDRSQHLTVANFNVDLLYVVRLLLKSLLLVHCRHEAVIIWKEFLN